MRLYAAIDLHSNNSVLVVIDAKDKVVYEKRHPNDLQTILAQLKPHKKNIQAIAVESTYNWYWLVDGLMAAGYNVKLVNPLPSGKEQCGAALRGHACDDISRISSAYRFQRQRGSRIVAGERPPCGERAERRRVVPSPRAASRG